MCCAMSKVCCAISHFRRLNRFCVRGLEHWRKKKEKKRNKLGETLKAVPYRPWPNKRDWPMRTPFIVTCGMFSTPTFIFPSNHPFPFFSPGHCPIVYWPYDQTCQNGVSLECWMEIKAIDQWEHHLLLLVACLPSHPAFFTPSTHFIFSQTSPPTNFHILFSFLSLRI